jgi:hypothetical protein
MGNKGFGERPTASFNLAGADPRSAAAGEAEEAAGATDSERQAASAITKPSATSAKIDAHLV